jgi:hypothetical protein
MAIKINDRVPVRVLGTCSETGAHEERDLTGCRFMGVLLHPVPWTEMERRFDDKRPGWRIVVHWPAQTSDGHPVGAGDGLQVDDETYAVCGVNERPGCYLEIYVGKP